MKNISRISAIALVFAGIVFLGTSSLHAQDDLLNRPVRLKVKEKRLDKMLEQLSDQQHIIFSYDSRIIQKDKLVTLTVTESTLRKVLAMILGNGYDFRSAGDYVIVRKKSA